MRVLVTGGRAPATLDLVRLLHRQGHVVHLAESVRGTLTAFSRAVTRHHQVRAPVASPDGFVDDLVHLVTDHAIDAVIPTCEEALWVARGRDRLARHTRVLTFGAETAVRLHGKDTFALWTRDLGFRTPATRRVTRLVDLIEAASDEVVFKPAFSRFGTQVRVGPAPPGAGTLEDDRFWREVRVDEDHAWIVQERLDGPHVSTLSFVREGRVVAHTAYPATFTASFGRPRRVVHGQGARLVAPSGATVSFEHVDVPPLLDLAQAVAAATGGDGTLAFDAIHDGDDVLPIECNPRLTSGVHLFHGRPSVVDAWLGTAEVPPTPIVPRPGARASLPYPLATYGLVQAVRAPGAWPAWLSAAFARDATFWWRDPLPTVMQPWVVAATYARAARHGVGVLRSTTLDIEWNGGAGGCDA